MTHKTLPRFMKRVVSIDPKKNAIDMEDRRIELSFSSEIEVEQWYGREQLLHGNENVDMEWMSSGNAPLLDCHNQTEQIGVVEKAWLENNRGMATVRFSSSEKAQSILRDIQEGIRSNVSVGYTVDTYTEVKEEKDSDTLLKAIRWKPLEISIVSVPADHNVGVGRSFHPLFPVCNVPEIRREPMVSQKKASKRMSDKMDDEEEERMDDEEEERMDDKEEERMDDEEEERMDDEEEERMDDEEEMRSARSRRKKARMPVSITGDPVKKERERVEELMALAERFDVDSAELSEHISRGLSPQHLKNHILDIREDVMRAGTIQPKKGEMRPLSSGAYTRTNTVEDIPDKEYNTMDLRGFFDCLFERKRDGIEWEYSQTRKNRGSTSTKRAYHENSVLIPYEMLVSPYKLDAIRYHRDAQIDMQQRVALKSSDTAGGHLIGTDHRGDLFVHLLRNVSICANLGARVITGLTGDMHIPTQTGASTTYWVTENASVTASDLTYGNKSLAHKTLAADVAISRTMLNQSDPSVLEITRDDLLRQIALAYDLAGLHGSGSSGQPTGIANTTGINAPALKSGNITANGDSLDWEEIVKMETSVGKDNALIGGLAYVTNSSLAGKLKTTKRDVAGNDFILQTHPNYFAMPTSGSMVGANTIDTVNGYRSVQSNQVLGNMSKGTGRNLNGIFFGNWSDLLFGMWSDIEIMYDPYSNATNRRTVVRATLDVDCTVLRENSFCYLDDLIGL